MSNEPADLIVDNLVKEFPTPSGALQILDHVSLQLQSGENLAVIGPSGSGKSTLLHIIGSLDEPTSGRVTLQGINPFALPEAELAAFRNQNIGFIFQEHHLLPQLSALENVLIPAIAAETSDQAGVASRAEELLKRVGLENRIEHRPGQLSGGERQRVAVARALLNQPELLLADEPTGSLDNVNAEIIGRMLLELQQEENVMLICVTHNDHLAGQFSRQGRLDKGKLVDIN